MVDFVEGWSIVQTLGEGAYGEVKLLVNKVEGNAVAMKIIDLKRHPEARANIHKEVHIHKMLNDPHIIRYFGQREDNGIGYIFLEYAPGGELFDRIEPDVGMESWEAQKYMKQLISGVEYLHNSGVAHRDLKPENLLLDQHDNLKITDFGMATLFRSMGKVRVLDKKCGTLPYMAPEVLIRSYMAEPADIWSCGIILVAMLAGELPWDKPTNQCDQFARWKNGRYVQDTPWIKIDNLALAFIRKILMPIPSNRYTISQIKTHRWCTKRFTKHKGPDPCNTSQSPQRKYRRTVDSSPPGGDDARLCHSQPEQPILDVADSANFSFQSENKNIMLVSFSQPAQVEDLLLSTQLLATQSNNSSQNSLQKLVRRMTRFFVSCDPDEALDQLSVVLERLGLTCRLYTPGIVTVTTIDKRKSQLVFKASILDMDGQTLLDFRLSKGCGLEFKKIFLLIKKCLGGIVKNGLVHWPVAIATNNVP